MKKKESIKRRKLTEELWAVQYGTSVYCKYGKKAKGFIKKGKKKKAKEEVIMDQNELIYKRKSEKRKNNLMDLGARCYKITTMKGAMF